MRDLVFVTGIHGNEHLPILALASMGIPQVVANSQAVKKNIRFIEMDMNQAFGKHGNTLEEKAARKLLEKVPPDSRVLDFHTTGTETPPFAIITDQNQLSFAQTLGLPFVVYMAFSIKAGHALIDHRPGVSVELGNHQNPRCFDMALSVVEAAKNGFVNKSVPVLEVYGKIEKPGEYINFKKTHDGEEAFYPILAGKNSYGFPGLKARLLPAHLYGTIQPHKEYL